MVEDDTHAHHDVRFVPCASYSVGIAEIWSVVHALRYWFGDVEMRISAVVSHTAYYACSRWRSIEFEGYSFLNSLSGNAPHDGVALSFASREIERFPTSETSSEIGMIGIAGVDLYVEHPVERCHLRIRSFAMVVSVTMFEEWYPLFTAIGTAKHFLVTVAVFLP